MKNSNLATYRITLILVIVLFVLDGCNQNNDDNESSVKTIDESLIHLNLSSLGQYKVDQTDYQMNSSIDTKVFNELATDVRGRLYLPKGKGPFPFLVFLHGNHATCGKWMLTEGGFYRRNHISEFTKTGKCPKGYVEAPSYAGYDYIAKHLASHGYAIISINANRGINAYIRGENEPSFTGIAERGKLVLKHLAQFSDWNENGEHGGILKDLDIKGKLNFKHVGFMGHSRGGEGVRAAYKMYREKDPNTYAPSIPNMKIEAIFELAPVDKFEKNIRFDAQGADWTVIIGTCDGDVKNFMGVKTFSRRINKKVNNFSSVLAIPGANHNNFNTEWHYKDKNCDAGDIVLDEKKQTKISLLLHSAFFRGFVGPTKNKRFQNVFDPQYRLPEEISRLQPVSRESLDQEKSKSISTRQHDVKYENVQVNQQSPAEFNYVYWNYKDDTTGFYTIPLNISKEDARKYEIISLSISALQDSYCLQTGRCEDLDFSIKLIFEGDIESKNQLLSKYVNFERYQEGCKGPQANKDWCMIENKNEEQCESLSEKYCKGQESQCVKYDKYEDSCFVTRKFLHFPIYSTRLPLYNEVPLEISDFSIKPNTGVKGVQFIFNKAKQGSFFLKHKITLRTKD